MASTMTFPGFEPQNQPNPRALPVNTILAGKYLVGRVLGEGGFGITYIGYDLNLQTKIAVKEYFPVELVHRDTTATGDRAISLEVQSLSGEKSRTYAQGLQKYVAEAQQIAKLADVPGVVSVKDFFYENNTAYIVMEFIDGISLKQYLKQQGGRLSEEETLAIIKPVLEALKQVHSAGIVHRDISPDNIMLTFSESRIASVRLIDFGAARMTAKNDQKSLTIILKHGYAPEEQYRTHGEQGPWTDVYALCATMYRMLSGVTPDSAMDRILSDKLKTLKEQNIPVSPNTEAAILAGLAVKKEDRIPSADELDRLLYGGQKLSHKGKTKASNHKKTARDRRKLLALLAAGLLLIAGVTGFFFAGSGKTGTESPAEFLAEVPAASPEATEPEAALREPETQSSEVLLLPDAEEESFGPAIVTASPQTSFASGDDHLLIRKDDGTVTALGKNSYGQCRVETWQKIAAVAAGSTFSAGLREDGRVETAGELENAEDVARWENVIEIAASSNCLFGLTLDGTLLVNRPLGSAQEDPMEYLDWTDLVHIAADQYLLAALNRDGQVLTAQGYDNSEYCGNLLTLDGWSDVSHLVVAQYAVFGLTESGNVRSALVYDGVPEGAYHFDGMDQMHDIVQLYSNSGISQYGVAADGSVQYAGFRGFVGEGSEFVFRPVSEWSNLTGMAGTSLGQKFAALTKDGQILKLSENHGTTAPEDMTDLVWADYFPNHEMLAGVTGDGRVLTYTTSYAAWQIEGLQNAAQVAPVGGIASDYMVLEQNGRLHWADGASASASFDCAGVTQMLTASGGHLDGIYCAGLLQDGTIRLYITEYNEYLSGLKVIEEWTGIRQIACDENFFYGLCMDGTISMADIGGNTVSNYGGISDAAAIFSGPEGIGVIRNDGTAAMVPGLTGEWSENHYGQLNVSPWQNLTQLSLSDRHTVGLCEDGTVVAAGSNLNGQCEVSDWKDIIYISAGENCTLGITKDGKLLIAGTLGW